MIVAGHHGTLCFVKLFLRPNFKSNIAFICTSQFSVGLFRIHQVATLSYTRSLHEMRMT